jgi:hypothetical protein
MRMIFGAIGGIKFGRGNRSTRRKPTPAPLCPPHNSTWQTRSRTPDRSGGKPATNRLSYGAAFFSPISSPLTTRRFTVEVFDPASTRVQRNSNWISGNRWEGYISSVTNITRAVCNEQFYGSVFGSSCTSEVSIGDRHGKCEDVECVVIRDSSDSWEVSKCKRVTVL